MSKYIYVVELQNNNFYVGETEDINVINKRTMKSQWITINGPIVNIIWDNKHHPNSIETSALTLALMKNYGINKVRGSKYSQIKFNNSTIREIDNYIDNMKDCLTENDYINIYIKVREINIKIGQFHIYQKINYYSMLNIRSHLMGNQEFINFSLDTRLTRGKKRKIFGDNNVNFYKPKDLTQRRRVV
jgi:hypothetical protein